MDTMKYNRLKGMASNLLGPIVIEYNICEIASNNWSMICSATFGFFFTAQSIRDTDQIIRLCIIIH